VESDFVRSMATTTTWFILSAGLEPGRRSTDRICFRRRCSGGQSHRNHFSSTRQSYAAPAWAIEATADTNYSVWCRSIIDYLMGCVADHKPAAMSSGQITGFRPMYITLTLPQSPLRIFLSIRFFLASLVWKMMRSRHNPADQRRSDTVPFL